MLRSVAARLAPRLAAMATPARHLNIVHFGSHQPAPPLRLEVDRTLQGNTCFAQFWLENTAHDELRVCTMELRDMVDNIVCCSPLQMDNVAGLPAGVRLEYFCSWGRGLDFRLAAGDRRRILCLSYHKKDDPALWSALHFHRIYVSYESMTWYGLVYGGSDMSFWFHNLE